MPDQVTGIINYFSHTIDGSSLWVDANPQLGWGHENHVRVSVPIPIHNLRNNENSVDLDTNGFALFNYHGRIHEEFDDNSDSQRCYFEEIAAQLQQHLGAARVIIFNHIFRSRGPVRATDQCDFTHKNPVYYPHADYDPPGARSKLAEILGQEEANKAMKNRWQIINVWRPVGPHPITNMPLTICDYCTIDTTKDLHVSEVRGSKATSSIYTISHSTHDAHRWWFVSEMRSDEMLVFKNYDSKADVAQFGAHTAFINEEAPSTDVEQKSIEIRCLVLYDH